MYKKVLNILSILAILFAVSYSSIYFLIYTKAGGNFIARNLEKICEKSDIDLQITNFVHGTIEKIVVKTLSGSEAVAKNIAIKISPFVIGFDIQIDSLDVKIRTKKSDYTQSDTVHEFNFIHKILNNVKVKNLLIDANNDNGSNENVSDENDSNQEELNKKGSNIKNKKLKITHLNCDLSVLNKKLEFTFDDTFFCRMNYFNDIKYQDFIQKNENIQKMENQNKKQRTTRYTNKTQLENGINTFLINDVNFDISIEYIKERSKISMHAFGFYNIYKTAITCECFPTVHSLDVEKLFNFDFSKLDENSAHIKDKILNKSFYDQLDKILKNSNIKCNIKYDLNTLHILINDDLNDFNTKCLLNNAEHKLNVKINKFPLSFLKLKDVELTNINIEGQLFENNEFKLDFYSNVPINNTISNPVNALNSSVNNAKQDERIEKINQNKINNKNEKIQNDLKQKNKKQNNESSNLFCFTLEKNDAIQLKNFKFLTQNYSVLIENFTYINDEKYSINGQVNIQTFNFQYLKGFLELCLSNNAKLVQDLSTSFCKNFTADIAYDKCGKEVLYEITGGIEKIKYNQFELGNFIFDVEKNNAQKNDLKSDEKKDKNDDETNNQKNNKTNNEKTKTNNEENKNEGKNQTTNNKINNQKSNNDEKKTSNKINIAFSNLILPNNLCVQNLKLNSKNNTFDLKFSLNNTYHNQFFGKYNFQSTKNYSLNISNFAINTAKNILSIQGNCINIKQNDENFNIRIDKTNFFNGLLNVYYSIDNKQRNLNIQLHNVNLEKIKSSTNIAIPFKGDLNIVANLKSDVAEKNGVEKQINEIAKNVEKNEKEKSSENKSQNKSENKIFENSNFYGKIKGTLNNKTIRNNIDLNVTVHPDKLVGVINCKNFTNSILCNFTLGYFLKHNLMLEKSKTIKNSCTLKAAVKIENFIIFSSSFFMRGDIKCDMAIVENANFFNVNGTCEYSNGMFSVYNSEFINCKCKIKANNNKLEITDARVNDRHKNYLTLSGFTKIAYENKKFMLNTDVKINCKDIYVINNDVLKISINGPLFLKGPFDKLKLYGDVKTNYSEYNIENLISSMLKHNINIVDNRFSNIKQKINEEIKNTPFDENMSISNINQNEKSLLNKKNIEEKKEVKKEIKKTQNALAFDIKLDVKKLRVVGNAMDIDFVGPLQFKRDVEDPDFYLKGKLLLKNGYLDFFSNRIKFSKGQLTFAKEYLLNCGILLECTKDFDDLYVHFQFIQKPNENIQFNINSNPYMEKDAILSKIIFRKDLKNLQPLEIAQLATVLMSFKQNNYLFNILNKIKSIAFFDTISFSQGDDNKGIISVGKFINDKIFIGLEKETDVDPSVNIQMELNKNISMNANTKGEVGVNWRMRF